MLLDLLAASAYKDLKERERKQAEGIIQAKKKGKYKGRSMNTANFEAVKKLVGVPGFSINEIAKTVGISRSTVIRYRKKLI
jgi:DNA invertase Pin-like site-specific DNA recombinase